MVVSHHHIDVWKYALAAFHKNTKMHKKLIEGKNLFCY
ncbi:hypothetical protein QE9_2197 [Clostridioides difficile CD104]|nr:hypothetical protein QE9_2197 [Clostridioides difficile CD104]